MLQRILTEEEKKACFEANKARFNKPESASAKHILVDSEELANDVLNKINNSINKIDKALEYEKDEMPNTALSEIKKVFPEV